MLITMLKDVAGLIEGQSITVADDLAQRWIAAGVACKAPPAGEPKAPSFADEEHDNRKAKTGDYSRKG